jgi:hypothetical protein
MKAVRLMCPVVLMLFCTATFAQSSVKPTVASDAQKSFEELKSLAGNWEGSVTLDPPEPQMSNGKPVHITMRVTSRGNTLVHEMQEAGTPLDPTKYDHPVTMFYLDSGHLTLVHYCDAGNRPRMVARKAQDDKTLEFDFAELSGGNEFGHMYHAVFAPVDANRHVEDWTYLMPGDKTMRAHFDLHRVP